MKKFIVVGSLGALLSGMAVLSSPAIAQTITREEVIVVAPYITHQTEKVVGPQARGVYDVDSLQKEVNYSDLDLSKPSDDDRFIQRINDTARQACAELRAKNPDPPHAPVYSDQECVKTAAGQALIVADSLISRSQVAMVITPAPQQQTAEVVPEPTPVIEAPDPAVEAEATVAPPAPKQDRN